MIFLICLSFLFLFRLPKPFQTIRTTFFYPSKAGQCPNPRLQPQIRQFSTKFRPWSDFSGSRFPNSFRKSRSHTVPQAKPTCGKCAHMDPLTIRFSSKTAQSICFSESILGFSDENTFFIFGHLKHVWEGFCVGLDPLGHPQIFFENQGPA